MAGIALAKRISVVFTKMESVQAIMLNGTPKERKSRRFTTVKAKELKNT